MRGCYSCPTGVGGFEEEGRDRLAGEGANRSAEQLHLDGSHSALLHDLQVLCEQRQLISLRIALEIRGCAFRGSKSLQSTKRDEKRCFFSTEAHGVGSVIRAVHSTRSITQSPFSESGFTAMHRP